MEPSVAALTEAEIRRERSITPTTERVLRTTGPRVLYVGGARRPALSEPQVSVGETIRAQQIMSRQSILELGHGR